MYLVPSATRLRLLRCVLISAATVLSGCVTASFKSIPEELKSSRLALHERRVFSTGVKYTLEGREQEPVHTLLGTYTGSFRDLLSQQPEALAEAERAVPYQYASLGIFVLGNAYAISQFVAAVNKTSEAQTAAQIDEGSGQAERAFGAAIATALFSLILRTPARSHLYDSVVMFNAGLDSSGPDRMERSVTSPMLSVLPSAVRLNPLTRQIDVGWTLRTGGGW